ncbi:uncharacterized protein LOC125496545 [Beta vulgaris subsp. vulgaris]|uniref:uncharacterized protein LOC125496545 n=1 Tax=Beta vulgaris subsp. vulgaris TaxID=3555 RepID=UPI002036C6DB|nr:uncharacterized protein LOC125496545 [Beta vulgaris subsp. vulgaris]
MLQAQEQLHGNPGDSSLASADKIAIEAYRKAQEVYMTFLKLKAKDRWICLGDANTKLFHQSIEARRNQNKIYVFQDGQGQWVNEEKDVNAAFVKYYQELLGVNMEIKQTMFSIPNNKAHVLDGYNSYFFKNSWDIVGSEVTAAVNDFFHSGKLLKSVNVTSITLIPKGAFVSNRSILHNILLCQDIVKMYRKSQKQKCCLLKIDLQKAYDTVSWEFLEEMLEALRLMKYIGKQPGFGFHPGCKTLGINHLYFADDLILFSRRDYISINIILQGVELFAAHTGLRANNNKFEIYS